MLTGETIPFKKVELTDKIWIDKYLAMSNYNGCEYSFGNIFLWSTTHNFQVADYFNCLIIKTTINGKAMHYYPAGFGDFKEVIQKLAKDGFQNGHPLVFGNVTREHRAQLDKMYPNAFAYHEVREATDYIYSREKLVSLKGKKYHGKRNHINRFKDNPNWAFEMMTPNNINECSKMSTIWNDIRFGDAVVPKDDSLEGDICAIKLSFKHFEPLGFEGGVLRQDGSVIAFTIGERLNSNTYVIHIEKAFHHIQGAYPMINQQFAQHLPLDIEYINREEDLGIESLRYSKMSYYPEILLTKYTATLKGNIL